MSDYRVPVVIRGHVEYGAERTYDTRRGGPTFSAPDPLSFAHRLPLTDPLGLSDLYALRLGDIVDFLDSLSCELDLDSNRLIQEACDLAAYTTGLSAGVLTEQFRGLGRYFRADFVNRAIDQSIDRRALDGWVEQAAATGDTRALVRAFGSRAVHVIAGNVPHIAVASVIRNAVTRSDAIIKIPSNDPLTAAAIARTMIGMAADHPLVRHLSVAYWKGGDPDVEEQLYHPRAIDKIVAWGGAASIAHAKQLAEKGIDVIALEPKHSAALIGGETLEDERSMEEAAERLSLDIGALDQEACMNSRVVYVSCGTTPAAIERLRRFGRKVCDALAELPPSVSGPTLAFDPELASELTALRLAGGDFEVMGGKAGAGGVVVSLTPHEVDFTEILANRVANIVPIEDHAAILGRVGHATQTLSVFPDQLKDVLRDRLALCGIQRLTSLGGATQLNSDGPQDGLEPLRRMCRWVVDEYGAASHPFPCASSGDCRAN